jgi:hypothetical protein
MQREDVQHGQQPKNEMVRRCKVQRRTDAHASMIDWSALKSTSDDRQPTTPSKDALRGKRPTGVKNVEVAICSTMALHISPKDESPFSIAAEVRRQVEVAGQNLQRPIELSVLRIHGLPGVT